MTIDEAIKILELLAKTADSWPSKELKEAALLSTEALKSVRTGRKVGLHYEAKCLPGETKAVDQRVANIGYGSSEALKKQRR